MTSPLDNYKEWVGASEAPKREIIKTRAQARLLRKHPASLSYKTVLINGVEQLVSIVDTTELPKKKIFSMPGESLIHGGLVDWEESKWLITEINAHNELYNEGRLERCNHLLKWKDDYGYLQERWCIIEDGTKLAHSVCMCLFGILETVCKNYSLNCWNTLRDLLTTA